MNKKQSIQKAYKPKKINKSNLEYNYWLDTAFSLLKRNKESIFKRISNLIKGNNDKEMIMLKELIKTCDKNKLSLEEGFQLSQNLAAIMQSGRDQIVKLIIIYLVLLTSFVISAGLFFWHIPYTLDINIWKSDLKWIPWTIAFIANSIIFFFANKKRGQITDTFNANNLLIQAISAYTQAKAPGKGGSIKDAYQQLNILRAQISKQSPLQGGLWSKIFKK